MRNRFESVADAVIPSAIPVTTAFPGGMAAFIIRYIPAQSLCSPKRQSLPGTKSETESFFILKRFFGEKPPGGNPRRQSFSARDEPLNFRENPSAEPPPILAAVTRFSNIRGLSKSRFFPQEGENFPFSFSAVLRREKKIKEEEKECPGAIVDFFISGS